MTLRQRLSSLERALTPRAPDHGPECDTCGAPGEALVFGGLHCVLVPEPSDDRDCPDCGRALDPETSRPIVAPCIIKIIRAESPEG